LGKWRESFCRTLADTELNETQHNLQQFEAKSLTGYTDCDIWKNVSVWVSKGLGLVSNKLSYISVLSRLERKGLVYIPGSNVQVYNIIIQITINKLNT